MKKKLDTRFPAARIKKIMQADEDVGKIANAVPVLVSKALELFLQDLCDRTYDITLQRGAKTVGALHLKHCIHSYNVFDFLREVVSKVPDYGHSEAVGDMSKKRRMAGDEHGLHESDEDSKRSRVEMSQGTVTSRGRSRGRGRGRGRGSKLAEREPSREMVVESIASEQSCKPILSPTRPAEDCSDSKETSKEKVNTADGPGPSVRNFDLNTGLDDTNTETTTSVDTADITTTIAPTPITSTANATASKVDEYPELSEMDRIIVDPLQVAQMNSRLDDEDEDYDEEG